MIETVCPQDDTQFQHNFNVVNEVWPDSIAHKAGIKEGDVLLAVNGKSFNDISMSGFVFDGWHSVEGDYTIDIFRPTRAVASLASPSFKHSVHNIKRQMETTLEKLSPSRRVNVNFPQVSPNALSMRRSRSMGNFSSSCKEPVRITVHATSCGRTAQV